MDGSGTERYILKTLKSQNDPDRRRRMLREVAALQSLAHDGIPKVVDHNTAFHADLNHHLFLVTEFIEGLTLESRINDGRLDIRDAIVLASRLVDVVDYCHSEGVVHRDIKPDNVILRHNNVARPVLIDFGQSFNADDGSEILTASGQQLGNRFLSLPELQAPTRDKRDHRSDLTQLCGILFYAITGEHPAILLDSSGNMPHQRAQPSELISRLPGDAPSGVRQLFDVGFSIHIDRRHQSAEALRLAIDRISTEASRVTASRQERLSELNVKLGNSQLRDLQRYRGLLDGANQCVMDGMQNVRETLGLRVNSSQGGYQCDLDRLTISNTLGLVLRDDERRSFVSRFTYTISGSELIVTATRNESSVNVFRAPVSEQPNWDSLREVAMNYFTDGLSAVCDDL